MPADTLVGEEIMSWSVDFPRKAESGWILPLVDEKGQERLLMRFETPGEANAAMVEFRAWIGRALEVRLLQG
jgi:hypothetical protein